MFDKWATVKLQVSLQSKDQKLTLFQQQSQQPHQKGYLQVTQEACNFILTQLDEINIWGKLPSYHTLGKGEKFDQLQDILFSNEVHNPLGPHPSSRHLSDSNLKYLCSLYSFLHVNYPSNKIFICAEGHFYNFFGSVFIFNLFLIEKALSPIDGYQRTQKAYSICFGSKYVLQGLVLIISQHEEIWPNLINQF